jgi:hypothetical protein
VSSRGSETATMPNVRSSPIGLTRVHQPPIFSGMATILKRLLTVCSALAFIVGATVQVLPSSVAIGGMGVRADTAGGPAGPQPPCTGNMPNCVDHVGCLTVSALPASPVSVAVAFEWASLDYDLAPESLSGISIKPELSPPILAA